MWVWRPTPAPSLLHPQKRPILRCSHSKYYHPLSHPRAIDRYTTGSLLVRKRSNELRAAVSSSKLYMQGNLNTNNENTNSPSAFRQCVRRARGDIYEDFSCWVETRWSETTMKHVSWGVWNEGTMRLLRNDLPKSSNDRCFWFFLGDFPCMRLSKPTLSWRRK